MSNEVWIALLAIAGGLFQIVGVLLIIREIATARELAREVTAPLLLEHFEPTYAPDLTERDKKTYELRHRLLEETARPSRADVAQQIELADERLRSFLTQQLTGHLGLRVLGVTLIVLGLLCATTGSTWAVLAGD